MNTRTHTRRGQRGVGLIEILVSVVIAMLLVLVIYQIYEISEGQKRTITAGSDAQQNAGYGLYVLGRDLAIAGNGIASSAGSLDQCALLRPIPVLIEAGATAKDPDQVTVLYGGSHSLSTPAKFKAARSAAQPYLVAGPMAFSEKDVIAAVKGPTCTVSTVAAGAGAVVVDGSGNATITHTPVAGDLAASYLAGAELVNLGQKASMGRIVYSVDPAAHALRTQKLLPDVDPVVPVVSDVINLKAQYGLDTDGNGIVDTWQDATGGTWSAATLVTQPLATLKQIRAVRVAIVTRSAQFEKDPITAGSPPGMADGTLGMFCDPAPTCAYTVTLSADDQHYRYKILETIVPLRNALWNPT